MNNFPMFEESAPPGAAGFRDEPHVGMLAPLVGAGIYFFMNPKHYGFLISGSPAALVKLAHRWDGAAPIAAEWVPFLLESSLG